MRLRDDIALGPCPPPGLEPSLCDKVAAHRDVIVYEHEL